VQQQNLQGTWHDLPAFLKQLRPAMQHLGESADANLPVLQNLNASASMLTRFFKDLPGFSYASKPALAALGKAGVTGKIALTAAKPTVHLLTEFAKHTPELAKNLSIILPELNTQKQAVEKNSRSPGGAGFSALEGLLQFIYNSSGAISYYGPTGHTLAVDAFFSADCSPFATPGSIASSLKSNGTEYRKCYAELGPNQPGVTTTDPSNPKACVPDPGGTMPGQKGDPATACKLSAASDTSSTARKPASKTTTGAGTHVLSVPSTGSAPASSVGKTLSTIQQTVSSVLNVLSGGSGGLGSTLGHVGSGSTGSGSGTGGSGSSGSGSGSGSSQTQRLLNYLLSP
jgi:hypothetical protein